MNDTVRPLETNGAAPPDDLVSDGDRWVNSGSSLRKSLQVLGRNRALIAVCVVLALVLALIFTLLADKIYSARASFEVQRDTPPITNIEGSEGASPSDRSFLQTQITLLKSRALAGQVVDRLKLADDTSFVESGAADNEADARALAVSRDRRRNSAINRVRNGLEATMLNDSSVIELTFTGDNPQLAARIANTAVDQFIQSSVERRFAASSYARDFLGRRLTELKERLETSERELIDYAGANGILALQSTEAGASSSQSLDTVALNSLIQRVAEARAQRIVAEESWRIAQSGRGANLPALQSDPRAAGLEMQLATMQSEYEQKLQTFKPEFGPMQELRSKIDLTRTQLSRIRGQNVDGLRASFQLAVQQEDALQRQLESLRGSVFDTQNRGIRYATLQREVDTNRALYDALLQRYKEIGVSSGSASDFAKVDEALTPTAPDSPILALNLLLALVAGLGIGVGIAFIKNAIDDRISTPEDVIDKLRLPLLGITPDIKDNVDDALIDQKSSLSEAYFSLQTALRLSTAHGLPKSLMVVSADREEGKSTSAIGIAQSIAARGLKVILVDSDLRRPSLHNRFGLDRKVGLSNVLSGDTPLADAIIHIESRNFDFIPAGPIPTNPAQLISTGFAAPLAELTAQYDAVVIDSPPVLGLADAPLLANLTEGYVFVTQAGRNHPSSVRAALQRLAGSRGKILGVVLSKFSNRAAGYGYAYNYEKYSYSYGRD